MKFIYEKGFYRAENALVLGDVVIGQDSNLWFYSVIRGDEARITIGQRVNIQDLSVLHTNEGDPLEIGDDVTIGHSAVIHGKSIGRACVIGMNATIMQGVEIGEGSIIGGGAVIPEGKIIPPRSVVVGVPGKVIKQVSDAEYAHILEISRLYLSKAREYVK
jgi:carbonic anhydrase/acetyltransferase-like protein (isoleucine patch superfamily)